MFWRSWLDLTLCHKGTQVEWKSVPIVLVLRYILCSQSAVIRRYKWWMIIFPKSELKWKNFENKIYSVTQHHSCCHWSVAFPLYLFRAAVVDYRDSNSYPDQSNTSRLKPPSSAKPIKIISTLPIHYKLANLRLFMFLFTSGKCDEEIVITLHCFPLWLNVLKCA